MAQLFCNSLEAGLETGGQLEICWRRQSIPWWLILPITTSLSWFLQETNWLYGSLPSRDVYRAEDLGPNLRQVRCFKPITGIFYVYQNMGISDIDQCQFGEGVCSILGQNQLVSSGNKLVVRFFANMGRLPGGGFRAKFKIPR